MSPVKFARSSGAAAQPRVREPAEPRDCTMFEPVVRSSRNISIDSGGGGGGELICGYEDDLDGRVVAVEDGTMEKEKNALRTYIQLVLPIKKKI